MKMTLMIALFAGLAVALPAPTMPHNLSAQATPAPGVGDSLSDAIVRINSDVKRDFGIMSPKTLTVSTVKSAIEFAANEVANSDIPGRTSYVNTLTRIAATGRIPDSVRFFFMPINASYSEKQKTESRDGRHVAISLNYVFEMPSADGRRVIGLTEIVEVFQIIKPQEQAIPFQPPKDKSPRKQPINWLTK